jgi:hypothetical protein
MGKLKTNVEKLQHKKVVYKKNDNGRCYNHIEGVGYSHYTKGKRTRKITQERVNNAMKKLLEFFSRLTGKKEEAENK